MDGNRAAAAPQPIGLQCTEVVGRPARAIDQYVGDLRWNDIQRCGEYGAADAEGVGRYGVKELRPGGQNGRGCRIVTSSIRPACPFPQGVGTDLQPGRAVALLIKHGTADGVPHLGNVQAPR